MKFIPALDGVRGLAILLVLVFHWFPSGEGINIFPNGPIGVTLFFVLSGYLITHILFNKNHLNFSLYIKNFLARRALRIFPIYYLLLVLILFLKKWNIEISTDLYTNPFPYFLYYYNHYLEWTGNWSDSLSPNWSLSVEEQFYLIWPLFIYFIRTKKWIFPFILAVIFLGILFRYFFIFQENGIGVIMLTCIDCFAWGSLLAYIQKEKIEIKNFLNYSLIPVLIIWIWICLRGLEKDLFSILFFRTSTAILAINLIFQVQNNHFWEKIMSFKVLQFIGKISYGLYLYHIAIPEIIIQIVSKFGIHFPESSQKIIHIFILFCFATGSYYILEKPLLKLKSFFD